MYGKFAFLANIGHSSVGYRHDHPANSGEFNACQSGIDPALIRAGGRFKTLLFEVESSFTFGLSGQYGSNHPDYDGCFPTILRQKYV